MKKILDKKRYFVIHSGLYKQDILVCFNFSNQEAFKIYKKYNKDFTEEDTRFIKEDSEHQKISIEGTIYPMSLGYIINIKWYKKSFRRNLLVAIHELLHATHLILRDVRIPLTVDTEEAYTYLLEDLTSKFLFKLY